MLRRPTDGRVLGGVAAAVAGRFGIDVTAVRTGFVVLALFGGASVEWEHDRLQVLELGVGDREGPGARRHR